MVNKYQGDVLLIEKLDTNKTFTALYWDAGVKAFYVKRFSFTESDNTPVLFIAEGRGSRLVGLSEDVYPRFEVVFAGKYAHREPEVIEAEPFIAKKGLAAKGKKCHAYDLKDVHFVEPDTVEPDVDIPDTVIPSEAKESPDEEPIDILSVPAAPQGGEAAQMLQDAPKDTPSDEEPTEWTLF